MIKRGAKLVYLFGLLLLWPSISSAGLVYSNYPSFTDWFPPKLVDLKFDVSATANYLNDFQMYLHATSGTPQLSGAIRCTDTEGGVYGAACRAFYHDGLGTPDNEAVCYWLIDTSVGTDIKWRSASQLYLNKAPYGSHLCQVDSSLFYYIDVTQSGAFYQGYETAPATTTPAWKLYTDETLDAEITDFSPAWGAHIATTGVTFMIEYYNTGDYDEVGFWVQSDTLHAPTTTAENTYTYALQGSQTWTYYTELSEGFYWGKVYMRNSATDERVEERLSFRVATTSASQVFGLGAEFATSSVNYELSCGISNFNLKLCAYHLFVPSVEEQWKLIDEMQENFIENFPFSWGYKILQELWYEEGTSTLPDLVLTIPDGMPSAGASIDLTPWDAIDSINDLIPKGTTTTFIAGVRPYWDFVWKLMFAIWLVFKLIGIARHKGDHDIKTKVATG